MPNAVLTEEVLMTLHENGISCYEEYLAVSEVEFVELAEKPIVALPYGELVGYSDPYQTGRPYGMYKKDEAVVVLFGERNYLHATAVELDPSLLASYKDACVDKGLDVSTVSTLDSLTVAMIFAIIEKHELGLDTDEVGYKLNQQEGISF